MRSEGMRLMEFSRKTTQKITLNECAQQCSDENSVGKEKFQEEEDRETLEECNSFEYDASTQECSLHSENGQPLGPSVLAKTTKNLAFFQQICLQEEFLCPTPYAFERRPQSILIGYAMRVHSVENLSDCLSLCLSLQHTLSLPCASALYFYETGECIMNQLTKNEVPHLFREGIEDSLVDYFENICLDVFCPNSVLHWLKSEDFHISNEKDVIVESMSVDECKALCTSNLIGSEKFPCRSYIFSSLNQQCHLSADHGITRNSSSKSQLEDLNLLSQPQFLHKMCLNTTVRCLDGSFEQITGKTLSSQPYKTFASGSSAICLSDCINEGANCASASFDYEKDLCHLSSSTHSSEPQLFITSPSIDYFDKICDTAPVEIKVSPPREDTATTGEIGTTRGVTETPKAEAAPTVIESEEHRNIETLPEVLGNSDKIEETEASAEETVIDDNEDFKEEKSADHIKAHLTSECRMSGVSIEIKFEQNTTGSLYVKDHFATCRSEFTDSNLAILHIPFPRNDEPNPRCPGTEISTSHWSFMVVIQRNQLSSTSLVTSTDRVFNVTCDYTELIQKSQQQGLLPVRSVDSPELRSNRIKMSILRGGKPVTVVPLGDYVELQWTVIDTEVGLGYFINECIAERIGGNPPHPEPLKIIYQGCPEDKVRGSLLDDVIRETGEGYQTTMKVFRFDGSRRVRIKCTIDVCVERCPPVICDGLKDGKRQESHGRKKRQSLQDLEGFIKRLKPNFSVPGRSEGEENRTQTVLWGTLTVTEREPKKKTKPEFSALSAEHICVFKWQITVFLSAFCAVCIGFMLFLGRFLYKRFCAFGSYDDASSYTTSSTSSIMSSERDYSQSQQFQGFPRKEGSFGTVRRPPVIYETPCIR